MLDMSRRLAAVAALVALAAALVVAVASLRGQVGRLLLVVVALAVACGAAWTAVTRRGARRRAGAAVAVAAVVAVIVLTLTGKRHGLAAVVLVALVAVSAAAARFALHRDRRSPPAEVAPGVVVGAARHPVLIINPKSGGGKAERFQLVDEAHRRGIETVLLTPGSDLLALTQAAVDAGADVVGMAGGDGSQALVASVLMQHDVAHVCIPSGTRNHFALDLGLDRDDVVGALDAFGDGARERRIDLAEVGERVFVNNVSLGVYAKIVQSPAYRDAKRETAAEMLPDLFGPGGQPFSLRFSEPDGTVHESAPLVLVSNNPYVLTRLAGFGTRARLDTGNLGITAVDVRSATDVTTLVALEATGQVRRYAGMHDWSAPTFVIDSDAPVEAGVDGEALVLEPPLRFRTLPGALRVRIPPHAPGWSPAALAPPSMRWTVIALVRTVAGRDV